MTETLVSILRQPPHLAPEDSVFRAIDLLRYTGTGILPVVDDAGTLLGVLDMHCLRPLLGRAVEEDRVVEPVSAWYRQPGGVGRADMSVEAVRGALAASGETMLFVVDRDRRYIGAVALADLLAPSAVPARPVSIGGMATPWGVYLTNGTLQAGVGNAALVGGGIVMGLMLTLAWAAVGLGALAAERYLGWPLFSLWKAPQPLVMSMSNFGWFLLQGLVFPLFLLFMRLLPLAGYHAAEHQAVHAMERGEMLHPDVLRHKRDGGRPGLHPGLAGAAGAAHRAWDLRQRGAGGAGGAVHVAQRGGVPAAALHHAAGHGAPARKRDPRGGGAGAALPDHGAPPAHAVPPPLVHGHAPDGPRNHHRSVGSVLRAVARRLTMQPE
jgi:CBS domain-containing protein